jgi:hypothetical protein
VPPSAAFPVKPSFFATIKACNYLPNALMKKEAVDLGVDFTVAFDEQGALAEGATENAGILTAEGDLRVPKPDRILAGTTMHRVLELARPLVESPASCAAPGVGAISRVDISRAREIFIFRDHPRCDRGGGIRGSPGGRWQRPDRSPANWEPAWNATCANPHRGYPRLDASPRLTKMCV